MQFDIDKLSKIYEGLKLEILKDNSIHLEHQYHYGCMYLSSSILGVDNSIWSERITSQIPVIEKWGTSSFVKESLNLSEQYAGVDSSTLLSKFSVGNEQKKYHALDYLYLEYFNRGDCTGIVREIKHCNQSGILFDTYIGDDGSKDLVYHCRNLEILLNLGVIKSDKGKEIISRSVSLIMDLLRLGSFSLFFGRSANSSYGVSSLYLILSVVRFDAEKMERERNHYLSLIEDKLFEMLSINQGFDLNFSGGRAGSDSYMYQAVYSSFALSRILLAKFGRYERQTVSYLESDLSGYFDIVKLSSDITLIYNGALGNKSAIFPSDFRYKNGVALAYLKKGKEHTLVPYFTFEFSPMDGYFRKQISLRVNGILARLFKVLNSRNILNLTEPCSNVFHSRQVSRAKPRNRASMRKLSLALVPADLKEALPIFSLRLFPVSLPTATGNERFYVSICGDNR